MDDSNRQVIGEHARESAAITILVLVAHVSDTADGVSAIGAMVFVGARIGHALAYMAGIPYLRTLIWAASIVGLGMIGYAIVM